MRSNHVYIIVINGCHDIHKVEPVRQQACHAKTTQFLLGCALGQALPITYFSSNGIALDVNDTAIVPAGTVTFVLVRGGLKLTHACLRQSMQLKPSKIMKRVCKICPTPCHGRNKKTVTLCLSLCCRCNLMPHHIFRFLDATPHPDEHW